MKKVLTAFLVALTSLTLFAFNGLNLKAEEGIIDLYPNDDITQLDQSKYGNSNWVLEFGGYRYHTVSFMARYASKFEGIDDLDKVDFASGDIPHVSANAMGGIIVNDTERDVFLSDGDRTRLTGVINRIWAYFDAEGRLVMFEDHISSYYIKEEAGTNYFRLATEAEIAEFEEAEEKPADMRHTHIRMVLNDDKETYKIEPLGNLKWTNADYVAPNPDDGIEEVGQKSVLFDYDPNKVRLDAGWKLIHFSTWDRGQAKFMDFIKTLPGHLVSQTEKAVVKYIDPTPLFFGFKELDVNDQMAGTNFVYEYGSKPYVKQLFSKQLSNDKEFFLEARHVNEDQWFEGTYTNVSFTLEILEKGTENVLETVNVIYNKETKKYEPSKEILESIDTEDFGAQFDVRYSAESPYTEGRIKTEKATIDVGVLPININNVQDRFIHIEDLKAHEFPINLLEGITADDNYGTDISDSLKYEVNKPFNPYFPVFGEYQVTVRAKYLFGPKVDTTQDLTIGVDGKEAIFTKDRINPTDNIIDREEDGRTGFSPLRSGVIITEKDIFELQINNLISSEQGSIWGKSFVMLDGTNKVVSYYDYDNTEVMYMDGTIAKITGQATKPTRDAYLQRLEWKENHKFIAVTAGGSLLEVFRKTKKDSVITGLPKVFEVEAERTYKLTVTDEVKPNITVSKPVLKITTDSGFESARDAVLSNVSVNTNGREVQISTPGLQRVDITEVGEHDVKVIVSDGVNTSEATFKLIIEAAKASNEDLEKTQDQLEDANDKIKELEEKLAEANTAIENKKSGASIGVVIVVAIVAAALSFGGSLLFVLLRKQ